MDALTQPHGRWAFSFWGPGCFDPPANALIDDVAAVAPSTAIPPAPWARFTTPAQIRRIFDEAGCSVEIVSEVTRYNLSSADDWWTLVMRSGFRAFVDAVPATEREAFARRHLDRVHATFNGEDGIAIALPVHYVLST